MISIDETVDEPNWLRYTERIAEFSPADPLRLRRPRALRPAARRAPSPPSSGWGRDALAVMDAAGCERAVVLALDRRRDGRPLAGGHAPGAGGVARHRQRHGAGRRGPRTTASGSPTIEIDGRDHRRCADTAGRRRRAPGHRHLRPQPGAPGRLPGVVGPGRPARRQPGHGHRLQPRHLLGRPALVPARHLLPDAGHRAGGHLRRTWSSTGRYLADHIAGARFVTIPGPDLLPWAGEFDSIVDEMEEFVTGARGDARGDTPAVHRAVHRHRRLDGAGGRGG